MRVAVLCAASVGKALCGVVAGGAKASLSAHFAVKGDVGELSAVDAGQETVVGLVGMLVCLFRFYSCVWGCRFFWGRAFCLVQWAEKLRLFVAEFVTEGGSVCVL